MGKGHTTPILTQLSTVFVSSGRTDIGYRLLSGRTGVRIPPWTSVHVAQLVERQKTPMPIFIWRMDFLVTGRQMSIIGKALGIAQTLQVRTLHGINWKQ